MKSALLKGLVVLLILGSSGLAAAESPQRFAFELKFGPYKPNADKGVNGSPYSDIFGSDSFFFVQIEFDWQFWHGVGNLGVGVSLGYGKDTGKALSADGTGESSDSAKFHLLPLSLSLIYRFDYLAKKFNVPLVPYVKIGLDYYLWWTQTGTGKIPVVDGKKGYGGVWGFHVNAGLKLLLDVFAPGTAKEFDNYVGVNNSYLFVELLYANINNFSRSRSLDLSDLTFMVGLAFEF